MMMLDCTMVALYGTSRPVQSQDRGPANAIQYESWKRRSR